MPLPCPPEPLSDWFARCVAAYYGSRDPFGADGDFITAPEISQTFGEITGTWLIDTWDKLGRPAPFALVELGPGRGTLMRDILRVMARVPAMVDATRIVLVETSPVLRAAQARTLADYQPTWQDSWNGLPELPTLVIANEFLDALPIAQLIRTANGWNERGIRSAQWCDETPASEPLIAELEPAHLGAPVGALAEIRPLAGRLLRDLARHFHNHHGAALFIDYGYAQSATGDTLQALKAHRFVDPLAFPADCDLTAHVDFAALVRAAHGAGLHGHGPTPQGAWLDALGIGLRLRQLAAAHPARSAEFAAAYQRLCAPDAMGDLFKVVAVSYPALPLVGFGSN